MIRSRQVFALKAKTRARKAQLARLNYNFEQFYCLDEIIYKESRWNYKAKNPRSTAYGLFQVLKSKEKDPIKQIDQGLKYINHRYNGCACTALAHHKRKGWY